MSCLKPVTQFSCVAMKAATVCGVRSGSLLYIRAMHVLSIVCRNVSIARLSYARCLSRILMTSESLPVQ